VLTVVQIGADKFANGHQKGRQENVDKRIVEETLWRPEMEFLALSKTTNGEPIIVWSTHDVTEKGYGRPSKHMRELFARMHRLYLMW